MEEIEHRLDQDITEQQWRRVGWRTHQHSRIEGQNGGRLGRRKNMSKDESKWRGRTTQLGQINKLNAGANSVTEV